MNKRCRHRVLAIACCLTATVLSACAGGLPAPIADPAPKVERDWLKEITAEASRAGAVLDVLPLGDPEIEEFRARAAAAMTAGRAIDAEALWRQALTLRADDPSLWQGLAESLLVQRHWADAEEAAARAVELGPRLGALCLRARYTMYAARIERGDAVGAASARLRVEDCVATAPTRY